MAKRANLVDDLTAEEPAKKAKARTTTRRRPAGRKRPAPAPAPWAERMKKKWIYFPTDMLAPATAKAEQAGYRGLSAVVVILVGKWLVGEIDLDD